MSEGRKIIQQAPKPTKEKFKTWEDLNRFLDANFHKNPHNHKHTPAIRLHEYEMDKDEIIEVLEEKGYSTKLYEPQGDHQSLQISLKE